MTRFSVGVIVLGFVTTAAGQFPAIPSAPAVQPTIEPLPFTPYVPPVHCIGKVGRDFINCVIPDWRILAGASFFNTEFERVYDRLYATVRQESRRVGRSVPEVPKPAIDPDRAVLAVEVDPRAEVFVESRPLSQPGPVREFISPPLKPGHYEYTVVIRWHDGQAVQQSQLRVPVTPGQKTLVVALTPGISPRP
jgi:hypothetical protein